NHVNVDGDIELDSGSIKIGDETVEIRVGRGAVGTLEIESGKMDVGILEVGDLTGAQGTVTIAGGTLNVSSLLGIGNSTMATGVVSVAGGQIIVPTNSTIWVGREGVGQMNVSGGQVRALGLLVGLNATNSTTSTISLAGGEITISSNLVVGSPSVSTSQVLIAGANLSVTNNSKFGNLIVSSGTLTLSSGILSVDNLIVTNASGQFVFGGGTLNTSGTVISSGLPFVVGDGTNPSTLHLVGGSHSFASGLIISSNSSLTGCRPSLGDVGNKGTRA